MRELDKLAMGKRIRKIRLAANLRQWELARLLGTTQSAVHKYEHGVIPEPRRLVELARIGGTTIEWVLTGRHWENGSTEQERLSQEVLSTASLLQEISDRDRSTLDEALRICQHAVRALRDGERRGGDTAAMLGFLRDHSNETLDLLQSAWRIQRAVLSQVVTDAGHRLENTWFAGDEAEERDAGEG